MKKRLDLILTERKFYKSREKSKEAITSSRVFVNGILVTKPSMEFDENCEIDALPFEFVSRGGYKLQKALSDFDFNVKGMIAADLGASTGGFTDCLLQNGLYIRPHR